MRQDNGRVVDKAEKVCGVRRVGGGVRKRSELWCEVVWCGWIGRIRCH